MTAPGKIIGYKIGDRVYDPADVTIVRTASDDSSLARELENARRMLWILLDQAGGHASISDAEMQNAPGLPAINAQTTETGMRLWLAREA